MPLQSIFTNADVLVAILLYTLLAVSEPFLEARLHRVFAGNPAIQWSWDQFLVPLLRAAMLVMFIYIAYPSLFGLLTAPSVGELLAAEEARTSRLMGLLFGLGFLFSMIPGLSGKLQIALPVQGCLAAGLVFSWLTAYLGITTASVWPGLDILLAMILASYFGHRAARATGASLGRRLDRLCASDGYDRVMSHVVDLLAQIPVIILYGYGLGQQIAI